MRSEMLLQGILLLAAVFCLTVAFEMRLIPWLHRRRAGQPILQIGPSWHSVKAGTPTLGGLGFIAASAVSLGVLAAVRGARAMRAPLLLFGFALSCALIGLLDDWKKLKQKQNKGLTALQKYALQALVCVAFLLAVRAMFGIRTAVPIPFFGVMLELGVWYYPLAILYLTGLVNALNLTDGVDGLLSSCCAVFAVYPLLLGYIGEDSDSFVTGALLLGVVLGFLCFNKHPAKVFMGDTGSLFLGAMVGGYGILSPSPLSVLIACGVFVAEAFSVILQVGYFKCTRGKRLFLMTPLHHHFEKKGWSEWRVVAAFSACGAIFLLIALLGR